MLSDGETEGASSLQQQAQDGMACGIVGPRQLQQQAGGVIQTFLWARLGCQHLQPGQPHIYLSCLCIRLMHNFHTIKYCWKWGNLPVCIAK